MRSAKPSGQKGLRSFVKPGAMNKFDVAASLVDVATNTYTKAKQHWRDNYAYTVAVTDEDLLYNDIHTWLISALPNEKHRTLQVGTGTRYETTSPDESGTKAKPTPLKVQFNDRAQRKLTIEGHPVAVYMITPDVSAEKMRIEPKKIEFLCGSHAAQQAVIRKLQEINDQRTTTRKATLKMVNSWGDWRTRSDLPPRTMASVSLPKEQKDRIVEDLGRFLDAEEKYNRLAIPWHRGYMLYGPPGTGKTSLVKALAHEFNLDLWYISLSDLSAESSLLSLLAGVGPRSILLLEDIDTAKITHDRDAADQGKISMSSLLNTLDGVATPHGLITFMTTNRFDILDPALTRAGRMDLIEELAYPSLDTIGDMFTHFFNLRPKWTNSSQYTSDADISTAQIAEVLKRNMDNYKQAESDVLALISTTPTKEK